MTGMLKEIGSIDEGPNETPCGREGASMIIYQRLTLTILRVPFLAPSSCDVTEVGGEDNFHTMHERSETKRAASTEVGWSSRATLVCALTCSKGGDGDLGGLGAQMVCSPGAVWERANGQARRHERRATLLPGLASPNNRPPEEPSLLASSDPTGETQIPSHTLRDCYFY
jgi:hypothetical protein